MDEDTEKEEAKKNDESKLDENYFNIGCLHMNEKRSICVFFTFYYTIFT